MTSITFPSGRTYDLLDGEHIAAPFANRWDGFKVRSDAGWMTDERPQGPLQRMSEGTNPTHGSALLLKD